MTERACGCAFTTSHIYGCPTGGGRINSPMTLHEDWHKAHPGYPCEYNTCPQGQRLDLENATYTAAEVKVLTEAALRLGRKEAQDECAAMLEERAAQFRGMWGSSTSSILLGMAKTIRSMASQPAPDASSARTDLSVDTDLPQDPQAAREAL